MLLIKPYRKSALAGVLRQAPGDAAATNFQSRPIPHADTSIAILKRRQPANVQALSSG
jgi:hypothetical protein